MSKVRCKVVCQTTGEAKYGNELQYTATFSAVYGGTSPENTEFFKWTPTLTLNTGILNKQHFKVGEEYYLDFTPVKD